MNILIIGYNPNYPLSGGTMMSNIIRSKVLKNEKVYILFNDSYHHVTKNKNTTIIGYSHISNHIKVVDYIKENGFKKLFQHLIDIFLLKAFYKKRGEYAFLGRFANKMNKEIHFDKMLIFIDPHYNYLRYLSKIKIKHKILYLIEPPLFIKKIAGKEIRTNGNNIDNKIIKTINKSDFEITMPHEWNVAFGKRIKKPIRELEFPFLKLYKPNNIFNKKMIYIGLLYYDIRNPQKLFDLMNQLKEYELHIYGNDISNDKRYHIPNNVFFHKIAPLSSLKSEIASCSALVNIENSEKTLHISSKIITYFGFQKPILSFGKRESMNSLYSAYGHFINVINKDGSTKDPQDIKKWIETSKNANIKNSYKLFQPYTIDFFLEKVFLQDSIS